MAPPTLHGTNRTGPETGSHPTASSARSIREFFARGLSRVSASPPQRPDANPPWLDHDQIAHELVRVGGNDFGYVSLRCVREAIQFQQDHAANIQALTKDQFAEIAILREKNAVFGIRRLKNILSGAPDLVSVIDSTSKPPARSRSITRRKTFSSATKRITRRRGRSHVACNRPRTPTRPAVVLGQFRIGFE
jgi:hypothetical protein